MPTTSAVRRRRGAPRSLAKSPTGIVGLDEITLGGLPKGRATLVTGGAGSGKTLLGIEFLVQGVRQFGEHGVLVAFEETAADLTENVRSLGFDLERHIARKQIAVDYVRLERSEIHETGDYDLEGLFVRLAHAIDSVGAKRVVIDTLEVLFAGLTDYGILRAELRRLFRWLKDAGSRRSSPPSAVGQREALHPSWAGGVRLGLRHPARSPGHQSVDHATPAHREVSRFGARHQ